MYRKNNSSQLTFEDFVNDFHLPFGNKLDIENLWIQYSKIIPWNFIEENYKKNFIENNGSSAKPARMAFGALFIKEKCGYSDRETVAQISENPYLQFLIGFTEFQTKEPFDSSLMVYFHTPCTGVNVLI